MPTQSWYTTTARLESLGFSISDAHIINSADGSAFKFRDDEHYARVADAMLQIVQNAMLQQGLERCLMSAGSNEAGSTVFISDNLSTASTVCIIVQGLGAVR